MSDQRSSDSRAKSVVVRDEAGQPLPGIAVTRVAANGTWLHGETDGAGTWTYEEPYRGTVSVLVSGPGRSAVLAVLEVDDWVEPLDLRLDDIDDGGSLVIHGSGYIPEVQGRLNPIRDVHGRTYIYGDNLSFEELPDQPYHFKEGIDFRVADSVGNRARVLIVGVLGTTSLVQYRLESSPQ